MRRIEGSEDGAENGAENGAHRAAQIAEGSRTLRNSVISLGVFFVIVVALLFGVPGLRSAGERITDANPLWVAGGVLLELLSCAGYVVLFDLVFGLSGAGSARGCRWPSSLSTPSCRVSGAGGHRAGRVGAAQRRACRRSGSRSARC